MTSQGGIMSILADRLTTVARLFSGRFVLYARHLDTGEVITFGDEHPMETASSIKLAIMMEAFRQAEAGQLPLDSPIVLRADDQVAGSGVLQHLTVGDTLPLLDVIRLMITVSDNTATNMVLRAVGLSSVNATLASLGLKHTRLFKRIDWTIPGPIGHSVPSELAELLARIHQGALVSRQASEGMWEVLVRQEYQTLLTRALPYHLLNSDDDDTPPLVQIGSKSGSVTGVRNDAGLVRTPWGTYVIAIMSEDCQDLRFHVDNEAMIRLPEVSRAVFDHFVGSRWEENVS
jgi:beta-lactamase class A